MSSDQSPNTNEGAVTHVKDGDLRILTLVGVAAMSVVIVFGAAVYWSGLLNFPALPQVAADRDYLNDTLVYRERRMAMALVMRTFLTSFSFVVGLALCTMGGLFILRQVTSLTELSGQMPGGQGVGAKLMGSADATPVEVAERLKQTQFSFSSYSPGVLFMIGGVAIMVVTQLLAIPVRGVEIVPPGASSLCENPETGNFETCQTNVALATQSGPGSLVNDRSFEVATTHASEIQAFRSVYVSAEALQALELPDGFVVSGFMLESIDLRLPSGGLQTFGFDDVNVLEPDWGIPALAGE